MSAESNHTLIFSAPQATGQSVELPLSKSVALRALAAAWCAGGAEILQRRECLRLSAACRDTVEFNAALKVLRAPAPLRVMISEGAAPLRFLLALAASTPGATVEIDAGQYLRRRPITPLLEALRHAGACIRINPEGFPITVCGTLPDGGRIPVETNASSQFASALMLAAPLWRNGATLLYDNRATVSVPYIKMTAAMMRRFGIRVEISPGAISIHPGRYQTPAELPAAETDWSAAAFLYETALLLPGTPIRIKALTPASASLQGDSRIADLYRQAGVSTQYHPDGGATIVGNGGETRIKSCSDPLIADMRDIPDAVPPLAVGLSLRGIPFRFSGVGHLRHKECDRLQALTGNLARFGIRLRAGADTLEWHGERGEARTCPHVATFGDHRMAMAFAPAAAVAGGLTLDDPQVVSKSFPHFWANMRRLGFILQSGERRSTN